MSKFCDNCPRRLGSIQDIHEPCQLGLLSLETKGKSGCEWSVNDAVSGYCFFVYLKNNPYAHTPKEICRLMGITTATYNQILESAFQKIKELGCEKELVTLSNEVQLSQPLDISIYDADQSKDKTLYSRHNKNSYGLNILHKSGKPQIYGLSKQWYSNYKKAKTKLSDKIVKTGDNK